MFRFHSSVGRWASMQLLYVIVASTIATNGMIGSSLAGTVTFGVGVNSFQIEFVTIGNPGNAPDTTGFPNPAGGVGYEYGIGKFEVSEDMVKKFNASQSLEITMFERGLDKPASMVSWNEAARFVNWLNTSKGGFAAYNFTSGGVNDDITPWTGADTLDFDPLNPFRSKRAVYVLPSYNEWYKAAYYNPINGTYFDYPTGSDTAPTGVVSGTADNTAVYFEKTEPADVFLAGGLSPYGVMGLGGNVWEWDESTHDVSAGNYNTNGAANRGIRGGSWYDYDDTLLSSSRGGNFPSAESFDFGFRVAMVTPSAGAVPEPASVAILSLGALGMAYRARRKGKA